MLGVVKSEPFQMNGKLQITSDTKPAQQRAALGTATAKERSAQLGLLAPITIESKLIELNRNKQETRS